MIERIKELRKSKGISQSELARLIGINQTQYNRYETGRTKIPSDVLLRIAQELGASVDYLLTGMDLPQASKGLFEEEEFANLYEALSASSLEDCTPEELEMIKGTARLITEFLKQRKKLPRPKKP